MADTFNARQQKFIAFYVEHGNATKAAELAGYSAKNAASSGSTLLSNPKIVTAIAAHRAALDRAALARAGVTRERIVAELAKIGFSNMADYTTIGDDGDVQLDFSGVTRDQMAAVNSIDSEVYVEGRGDEAQTVKRTKFKLSDKRAALMDLARLEGHIVDRQQITGPGGGPLQHQHIVAAVDLSPEAREKLREALTSIEETRLDAMRRLEIDKPKDE